MFESNRGDESNENGTILDGSIMYTDSCQWEQFSEF